MIQVFLKASSFICQNNVVRKDTITANQSIFDVKCLVLRRQVLDQSYFIVGGATQHNATEIQNKPLTASLS